MSSKPPPGLSEDDYEAIEDAVLETVRGRWFLREYARRNRAADTGKLLEALTRIERLIAGQTALPGGFMPEPHAQALDERHNRFAEIAWTLRERGYDGSICALIENEARALARLADNVRAGGPLVECIGIAAPVIAAVPPQAEAAPPQVQPQAPPAQVQPQAPPAQVQPQAPPAQVQPQAPPAQVQPQAPPAQTNDAPRARVEASAAAPPPSPPVQQPTMHERRLAALAAIDRLAPREKAALFA